MRLKRISVQNVRSFLDRRDFAVQGSVAVLVGPNGGGKTNLLDAMAIILRRYLLQARYAASAATAENARRRDFRPNDQLNSMILEKHSDGQNLPQVVEVELEITDPDIAGMIEIQESAEEMAALIALDYASVDYTQAKEWDISSLKENRSVIFKFVDGRHDTTNFTKLENDYNSFLKLYEIDRYLREEFGKAAIAIPFIYLPTNRASGGLSASVQLTNYDWPELKRTVDTSTSKRANSIAHLAISRLAKMYRLLLERDTGSAQTQFRATPEAEKLTKALRALGYDWDIVSVNPLQNQYDIELTKRGSKFMIGQASSGESELLNYIFGVHGLNIRDALIIVDEPELHLHPDWQKKLLRILEDLALETNSQFVIATHSPQFITPSSVEYVTRVYNDGRMSELQELSAAELPERRHLFNIVNSLNNEKIFFADKVLLVEGLHDAIFVSAAMRELGISYEGGILEVVSVGGKGLFRPYRQLLSALHIKDSVLADFDYLTVVGSPAAKALFSTDMGKIAKDVLLNPGSRDGASFIDDLERSIESGDWTASQETWEKIKRSRLSVPVELTHEQSTLLDQDIERLSREQVYVLRHGELEDYLPDGYRSKDTEKLVALTSENGFWQSLDATKRLEIETILRSVCEAPAPKEEC